MNRCIEGRDPVGKPGGETLFRKVIEGRDSNIKQPDVHRTEPLELYKHNRGPSSADVTTGPRY